MCKLKNTQNYMSLSDDKQADSIVHPDIWMTFQTLIMFILTIW